MGYRDDFYILGNIIGYTGKVDELPTVYFLSQTEFGHITQQHDIEINVGRQEVLQRAGYTYENEIVAGVSRLVERLNGGLWHVSRNALMLIANLPPGDLAVLAQAITNYQMLKVCCALNLDDNLDVSVA